MALPTDSALCSGVSVLSELAKRGWPIQICRHTLLNICLFPPLFFFYGLYYTDVASTVSVLVTYFFYLSKQKKSFLASGLASLWFRQTNIFWVAIYMGGLEVVRALQEGRPEMEPSKTSTIWDTISGSWQHSFIYVPLAAHSDFRGLDFLATALARLTSSC